MSIVIYGASDDLVEIEGCEGADEFSVYDETWRGDLIAPNGEAIRVHLIYDGCWHVALGQVIEDVQFPDWPVRYSQQKRHDGSDGYSARVEIDAPEGTCLTNVGLIA